MILHSLNNSSKDSTWSCGNDGFVITILNDYFSLIQPGVFPINMAIMTLLLVLTLPSEPRL